MEVQSCVVWVGMTIPATLPSAIILVCFDVVKREISRREPTNIESGRYNTLRILSRVDERVKQARLVGIWVEFRLSNKRFRPKVSS